MLSESLQHGPALQQSAPSTTGHARRENATESHDSGLVSGEKLEGQSSTAQWGAPGQGRVTPVVGQPSQTPPCHQEAEDPLRSHALSFDRRG